MSLISATNPWLGLRPSHWREARVGYVARIRTGGTPERANLAYWENGTIPWIASGEVNKKIIYDTDAKITRAAVRDSNAKPLPPNSVMIALNGQGKTKGTVAILKIEATCNQSLAAIIPDPQKLHYRYLFWYLESRYRDIRGLVGEDREGLNLTHIRGLGVYIPPLAEQIAIADFLDLETARVDSLIGGYQRLVELLREEVASQVLSSVTAATTRELRLGVVARVISRPVIQKEGQFYTPVGIFNRGRGLFHKAAREMADMGDSEFFWLEEGDFIISGQFAWEGAIALAGEEDSGCVVSHRYHVLRGKDGAALTEYLLALMSTTYGDFLLNENSRGAAGRNRPLNINSLLKEKIPVPDHQVQQKVASAIHCNKRLFTETSKQIRRLREYRFALINAAVTGQIDVRTYRAKEAAAVCQ
jgi:type I restriction enzyme S subunit